MTQIDLRRPEDNGINHTHVSPSGVGDYAVCPYKLVLDSQHPGVNQNDPYVPHKDFGTVCHYTTQYMLGCAPAKAPTEAEINSARSCPGVPKTPANFNDRVTQCSSKAIEVLNRISPLPAGTTWVSEHHTTIPTLLPWRLGRNSGKVEGFGGSIDLLRSDREILWDLKFVGRLPDDIKTAYLWQLATYHLSSKVPQTGILWTTRDSKNACHLLIDWRKSAALQDYLARVYKFIEFTSLKKFTGLAWPVKGEACAFCKHKGVRCPLYDLPKIVDDSYTAVLSTERTELDDLLAAVELEENQGFSLL